VEHPVSRFLLTLLFFHLHNLVFVLAQRVLLARQDPFLTTGLLISSLANAALAVVLFPLLDRLRRT
jgi:hypothetical protein